MPEATSKQVHSIRAVSKQTGLSPHVIRVWERRYKAVEPVRSETRRRMYSDAEVERLKLLQAATSAGHSIGNIANLPAERLSELIRLAGSGASAKSSTQEGGVMAIIGWVFGPAAELARRNLVRHRRRNTTTA